MRYLFECQLQAGPGGLLIMSVFFGFYASMHYIDDEGSPYARGKVNILALPAYYGLLWSVKQNNILANN